MQEQVFSLTALAIFMIILIYWSGWFSGIETALTHIDPVQLAGVSQSKEKNIEYILKLKRHMNRTLIAILIGNNVVNILFAAIATLTAKALFRDIGISISIGIITFLIIIFGEITPKSNAITHSKKVAQKHARTLFYLTRIISPVIDIFIFLSRFIIKLQGGKANPRDIIISDESIKDLITLSQKEGVIKPLEEDLIYHVFRFGDLKTENIMVPMKKVFALSDSLSSKEVIKKYQKQKFTESPFSITKVRLLAF